MRHVTQWVMGMAAGIGLLVGTAAAIEGTEQGTAPAEPAPLADESGPGAGETPEPMAPPIAPLEAVATPPDVGVSDPLPPASNPEAQAPETPRKRRKWWLW